MKTTIKTIALSCLLTGLILTSCKKEETPTPTPLPTPATTKTELLTGKNWKIISWTSNPAVDWNGDGVLITDIYAQIPVCGKDNTITFNANGAELFDEGPTKCSSTDPQTASDVWFFNPTETAITMGGFSFNLEILNTTTLKTNRVYNYNGYDYTFTYTYAKQ